jgi:hypothetical protein
VSSDQDRGAPSFGDLFDDPDAPDDRPASVPASPAAAARAASPVAPAPAAQPDTTLAADAAAAADAEPAHAADTTGEIASYADDDHDLAHVSSEAEHQVAGFEHLDDEGQVEGSDDEALDDERADDDGWAPTHGTPDDEPSMYDSVMIAPLAGAMSGHPDADQAGDLVLEPEASPRPVTVAPLVAGAAGAAAGAAAVGAWDGVVDPAVSSAPATRVDTGRLYRSSGAEGPATLDAIPALDPGYVPARRVEEPVDTDEPVVAARRGSGLTYTGVVVVVFGATVLAAFVEALIKHQIGAITGVALAVSAIYSAVVVRRSDIWAAVVMPPLAFLAAALTAGQLTLDKSGSLLIREGFTIFRTLAVNAPWILGTTLVCLVIVLVRRRRG